MALLRGKTLMLRKIEGRQEGGQQRNWMAEWHH